MRATVGVMYVGLCADLCASPLSFLCCSLYCSLLALRDAVSFFVVCLLPFVLRHEVLFVVLMLLLEAALVIRFVVRGLVL